tara:strand:+ start:3503 stop:3862 length:360 start_codon:yes stop_codon:yes gene_type:complete
MDLELYPKSGVPIIEGYGTGYVTISGKKVTDTLILYPDKFEEIEPGDISSIIKSINLYKNKLDLIIYGSLIEIENKNDIIKKLNINSLPIEFMQTSAACRTWTVLIGEGRAIGAIIETS